MLNAALCLVNDKVLRKHDAGNALHVQGVCSTLRSERKVRGVIPRRYRDDKSPTVPPSCPFRNPRRVLREGTKRGLLGTTSLSPVPPSEWIAVQSVYGQIPKPGYVQSYQHFFFTDVSAD